MTDPLQVAFDRYNTDGDSASLLEAVQRHGGRAPAPSLDCPIAHRICDIELTGNAYRVVRVADPDDQTTRLFIYPIENAHVDQPGVPIALRGDALWHWVRDELECPTDGPTEWSRYDSSLTDDA